jgi:hypothetical protein
LRSQFFFFHFFFPGTNFFVASGNSPIAILTQYSQFRVCGGRGREGRREEAGEGRREEEGQSGGTRDTEEQLADFF